MVSKIGRWRPLVPLSTLGSTVRGNSGKSELFLTLTGARRGEGRGAGFPLDPLLGLVTSGRYSGLPSTPPSPAEKVKSSFKDGRWAKEWDLRKCRTPDWTPNL